MFLSHVFTVAAVEAAAAAAAGAGPVWRQSGKFDDYCDADSRLITDTDRTTGSPLASSHSVVAILSRFLALSRVLCDIVGLRRPEVVVQS